MKIHLDPENKQVSIEGSIKLADLFNRLMSWFAEGWEEWTLVPHKSTIEYKEVIVDRTWWRDPYWNPYRPYQIPITFQSGTAINSSDFVDPSSIVNTTNSTLDLTKGNHTTFTASNTNQPLTLNLNNL